MGFKARVPRKVYLPPSREALLEALRAWDGHVSRAAKALGLTQAQLRRMLRAEGITVSDRSALDAEEEVPMTLREARRHFERMYVERVLAKLGGRRRQAAKALDISLSSLKNKLTY